MSIQDSPSRSPLEEMTTPRRKYKKNYLKQVIARIDFVGSIHIDTSGPSESVLTAIKSRFPISEPAEVFTQKVKLQRDDVQRDTQKFIEWRFFSAERDRCVAITQSYMYVEYKTYTYYEDLRADFTSIAHAMFRDYRGLIAQRIGLRYVDNIELDEPNPTEWSNYIHEDLIAALRLVEEPGKLSRAFQIVEQDFGIARMKFQFGMPNPDYPAPIRKKLFVLDHDAYTGQIIEEHEIAEYLDIFHGLISRSFESVITDGLRDRMGEINE